METTYHIVTLDTDAHILQQYTHMSVMAISHFLPIEYYKSPGDHHDFIVVCNLTSEDRTVLVLQGKYIKEVTVAQISQRVYSELNDDILSL